VQGRFEIAIEQMASQPDVVDPIQHDIVGPELPEPSNLEAAIDHCGRKEGNPPDSFRAGNRGNRFGHEGQCAGESFIVTTDFEFALCEVQMHRAAKGDAKGCAIIREFMPNSEDLARKPHPDSADFPRETFSPAPGGPAQGELTALVLCGFVLFASVVMLVRNYAAAVDNFADSSAYMGLASAIRHWDFHGVVIKQFWGLPYAMAVLSRLTGLSDRTALLLLSFVPSLIAVVLARRLWDGWIAGYFAVLNFEWIQRSCLGGSEPLFVCLLFGAFICVRRQRWMLAALLASFATIVRPLGVFALLGIGIALLWKRDFRKFAAATAIGLAVGVLYSLPLAIHFGDALATVNSYHSKQWQGGWLFGFPFYAIVKGTILYPAPWTNLILSFGWIFLVVLGTAVMTRSSQFRAYCKSHLVEAMFLVPYLWCLFTYNYPVWARSNFERFAIPILPFVFLALYRWLPKDRRILWGLGVVSPILAASSALGVVSVVHMLQRVIHR